MVSRSGSWYRNTEMGYIKMKGLVSQYSTLPPASLKKSKNQRLGNDFFIAPFGLSRINLYTQEEHDFEWNCWIQEYLWELKRLLMFLVLIDKLIFIKVNLLNFSHLPLSYRKISGWWILFPLGGHVLNNFPREETKLWKVRYKPILNYFLLQWRRKQEKVCRWEKYSSREH